MDPVILLPAHPASFAHDAKVLFQRVLGCNIRNSIADLPLKIVFWTHKFAFGLIDIGKPISPKL